MKALLSIGVALTATRLLGAPTADVYFLGEVHDNPAHHAVQVAWIEDIKPAVVVFEMVAMGDAMDITPALIADQAALEAHL